MSHFQNVFIQRGKTLEGEDLNGFGKLKNNRKSNKKIYKSPTLEKSNINKLLNQSFNTNETHSPKQRQSLKKVALGIQNFISKVLVDNSNDTKYFDVNEELEEIKKAKVKTLNHKDFYHINEGDENINKYLNITFDNDKKNNFHSTKQIGLGFFKKNDANRKNYNKNKMIRTMTDDNLKKFTHHDNSFSSTHKFLTSNKHNSSQSNEIILDPFNPLNKDYSSQLRKTSYEEKMKKDKNLINDISRISNEGIKSKINNNSSSLKLSLNTLRSIIENGVQNKKNSNDNNSKEKINENNIQKHNNSYDKNLQNKIKTYENNINNNLHLKLSNNENNSQKKVNPLAIKKEKKNEIPLFFNRRKNKERSQMINKWLIYSRIMAISNPKSNEDLVKFSRKNSTRKVFQTINPISSKRLQKQLKIKESDLNNKKKSSSKSNLTKYNDNDNLRPKLSKHFSRSKFRKYTKNNKSNYEKIIHPKKSKTSLDNEKNNVESLLNVESLKQNILKPEYKSIPMDTNLSIIEHKSYLEEGKKESNIGSINFDVENIKETRYRRMMRTNKLVYDSLSDEESDEILEENEYISPNSQFKYYFDLTIFTFAFYTFCVNPIFLCFYPKHNFPFIYWYNFINIFIDLVYISDLILGFFTAYYDIEERYIKRLSEITINYLSSWFTIDLLSSIPFTTIYTLNFVNNKNNYTYSGDYELYELFEIFRLFKIYKAIYNNEFFHYLLKSMNKGNELEKYFILIFYSLIVILHGHLLACINIFLSNLDYPNWVTVQNLNNSPKTDIYIASFYYIFSTVTTVGYGDIVSINIYERFNNLILLVVGIMVYSYCVSSLSNYVQQVDSKTLDYQEKSRTLEQIRLNHEKMPQELYEKISRFLKYKLTNESKVQNELIDNLPIGLRSTLIMEMYKPVIDNFIFFKTFNSSDFIIKVIMAFRPILSLKNEKLINEGDYIEEIVFVKKGALALELPLPIYVSDKEIEGYLTRKSTGNYTTFEFNRQPSKKLFSNERPIVINFSDRRKSTLTFIKGKGMTKVTNNTNNNDTNIKHVQQYVKIIEIRKNEHFGDILMFLNKRSPLSMKVKTKYAELFLLNKTDAVEISMSFPKIWGQIIKKSLFNMEQIERLINKTLKFFYIQNDRAKRRSYYLRDLNNNNTFVNTDYYANLNEKDYELQSIPTSSIENLSSHTEKNSLQIISSEDSSSNYSESDSNSFYSSSNMSSISKNRKLSNISLNNKNDNNTNLNLDLKNQNKRFLNRGNETIKEEISDEENDTIIKNSIIKKKSSRNNKSNNKDTLIDKVSEKEEEDSSNKHVIFSSSSSSKNSESKKTMKETEEYNLIDFNSFSSRNNTIVYPYTKSEINKEELPFENNISAIENNNNIIHSIVPKIYDIFGKPENLFVKKFSKETNFTTSSFSINISCTKNNNSIPLLIISHEKEFVIVRNESFVINSHRNHIPYKKYKSLNVNNNFENNFNKKQDKKSTDEEKELQRLKMDFLRKENKGINKTFKEKSKSRRFSKMIIESDSQFNNNNEKTKENPKMRTSIFPSNKLIETSKETLSLIGKNIESNSLALNNPKMFYQNYFSNVVQKTSQRKSVVIRLKDLEKIIKHNNPINNMNSNRNSVGIINANIKPEKKYRHASIEIRDFNNKKDET